MATPIIDSSTFGDVVRRLVFIFFYSSTDYLFLDKDGGDNHTIYCEYGERLGPSDVIYTERTMCIEYGDKHDNLAKNCLERGNFSTFNAQKEFSEDNG